MLKINEDKMGAVKKFGEFINEAKSVGHLVDKMIKSPTGENLYILFTQINKDAKANREDEVALTDTEYYADQIQNLYEYHGKDISDEKALELAKLMAEYVKTKGIKENMNEALSHDEKIKVEAKIELLEFLNSTYDYPKTLKEYHEAYIRELQNKLK